MACVEITDTVIRNAIEEARPRLPASPHVTGIEYKWEEGPPGQIAVQVWLIVPDVTSPRKLMGNALYEASQAICTALGKRTLGQWLDITPSFSFIRRSCFRRTIKPGLASFPLYQ